MVTVLMVDRKIVFIEYSLCREILWCFQICLIAAVNVTMIGCTSRDPAAIFLGYL